MLLAVPTRKCKADCIIFTYHELVYRLGYDFRQCICTNSIWFAYTPDAGLLSGIALCTVTLIQNACSMSYCELQLAGQIHTNQSRRDDRASRTTLLHVHETLFDCLLPGEAGRGVVALHFAAVLH
jgi:hypothetical protein